MKYFHNKDRVRVAEIGNPLHGKFGTVVRLLKRDDSAWVRMDEDLWVRMDEDLPMELLSFPDSSDKRYRDIVLWPDQCEKA